MTIIVGCLQLVLFVLMRRRAEWAVAALAVAGALFLVALVVLPGFPTFLWYTLSGQEVSTVGHINDLWNGIIALLERPWGYGLGTADAAAARAGLTHITGDNLFLTYGVELGLAGLTLLIVVLGSIAGHALTVFRQSENGSSRLVGLSIWLATLGIVVNGMTAVVFNSIVFGWLYFWLAGSIVTLSERLRVATGSEHQLELTPVG
jgi:O-antigen ligase